MDIRRRNNVVTRGEGPRTFLFAHGYGCDQNMWRFVAPAFEPFGRVVLFDHVGSGASDPDAFDKVKYSSLAGYASDVVDICEALDLRDVVFVGHSVSAMIGALAAIRSPSRFSDLIMVAPSPCYLNDGDYHGGFERKDIDALLESLESNYLGWSSAMAPVIMGNSTRPELSEELNNSFCRTDPEKARVFARATFLSDLRDDMPKVSTPSLILQCAEDVIAPVSVGHYLHRVLPRSELTLMGATGHCPNLSAPDETIAAMRTYLGARPGMSLGSA